MERLKKQDRNLILNIYLDEIYSFIFFKNRRNKIKKRFYFLAFLMLKIKKVRVVL
jgi:hypothetical protein